MTLSARQEAICLGSVGTVMVLLLLHALILGIGASPFSVRTLERLWNDEARLVSASGLEAEFVAMGRSGDGLTLIRDNRGRGVTWFGGMKPAAWAPRGDRILLTAVGEGEDPRYTVVAIEMHGMDAVRKTLLSGKGSAIGFSPSGEAVSVASAGYTHKLVPVMETSLTVASLPER